MDVWYRPISGTWVPSPRNDHALLGWHNDTKHSKSCSKLYYLCGTLRESRDRNLLFDHHTLNGFLSYRSPHKAYKNMNLACYDDLYGSLRWWRQPTLGQADTQPGSSFTPRRLQWDEELATRSHCRCPKCPLPTTPSSGWSQSISAIISKSERQFSFF